MGWFFDVFVRAVRADPIDAGKTLAADAFIGLICLCLAAIGALSSSVAVPIGNAAIGLLLIAGTAAVARRPGASDRVLVAHGFLLVVLFGFMSVHAIDHLVQNGSNDFKHGPGLLAWLVCHASLHWVHVGARRSLFRVLPRLALLIGIACEFAIASLILRDCTSR